jgi:4,5-DOPA dioxygenase extradiol
VRRLLANASLPLREDPLRGYDHGAWVPLLICYPRAEVPVVQLSLVRGADARHHFRIGEALSPLRDEGVLVVGSGASVHNLRRLGPEGSPVPAWASAFDDWLEQCIAARRLDTLLSFPREPAQAALAHPRSEHFDPIFVAMGAGWPGGHARQLHRSYSHGSLGMACYAFGGAEVDTLALGTP